MFLNENNYRLIRKMGGEILCVEAWGENSLRVRAVQYGCKLEGRDGAISSVSSEKCSCTRI